MNPDALALFRRKPRQREIVEVNEAVKEVPRGIDFHSQASFGEVHLNLMRALFQAAAYLGFMLTQQILDELVARIISNALDWVHQTQCRRRYYRLLDRHVGIAHGHIQVRVRVPPVTKRASREPRHAARMAIGERDFETIGGSV